MLLRGLASAGTVSHELSALGTIVKVISSIGVWHMIRRIRNSSEIAHDEFEQRALRITGYSLLPALYLAGCLCRSEYGSAPQAGNDCRVLTIQTAETWTNPSRPSIQPLNFKVVYQASPGTFYGIQFRLEECGD
jgi:hypothetical protein